MKAPVILVGALTASSTARGFVLKPHFAGRGSSSSSSSRRSPPERGSPGVHVSRQLQALKDQTDLPPTERQRPAERNFITILSEDGTEQMLPVSWASSFPLWVIDGDEHADDTGRKHVAAVPGPSEELGWVNPRSYSELWIPDDSPTPTMKLCLGMLMKDGQPRYVMPMVDLVVSKGDRKWRNRGLNSVPMAHTWEPVGRAAGGGLFLSAYAEEKVEGSETDFMWGTLAERVPVTDAFTEIVSVLADPPEEVDLGSGFHLLVAEVATGGAGPGGSLVVPAAQGAGGRVRVFLTDLSEPADLLDLEELEGGGAGSEGVATLGFDVVSVANGGESEFLPDVYRPFFKPEQGIEQDETTA